MDVDFHHCPLWRTRKDRCQLGAGVEKTLKGGDLCAKGRLRAVERMNAGMGGVTFASDQAAIRGGAAPVSTGGELALCFSGFSA